MIKFEPGVKRPKLIAPETPPPQQQSGHLKTQATGGALYYQTLKLPNAPVRSSKAGKLKDDSAYVKGESAISYTDLAKPEVKQKKSGWLFAVALLVLAIIGAACYYFFFLHHAAH